MEKNESEQIIKEAIEFANEAIKKNKRRSLYLVGGVILGVLVLLFAGFMAFCYEIPVAYEEGLISVVIPEDEGIDIHVELKNYKRANAVLVNTGNGRYDLYIGVMQTVATKLFKDPDVRNNFLRVGNGIILDHQGEQLWGHLPEGQSEDVILNIYYLDKLTEQVAAMSDLELIAYKNKTLIWSRES